MTTEATESCQEHHNNDISQRVSGNINIVVVHIPLNELEARRFELPPRHKPFCILVGNNNSHYNNNNNPALQQNVFAVLKEILLPKRKNLKRRKQQQQQHEMSNSSLSQQMPWDIRGILIDNEDGELWKQASSLGLLIQQDDHDDENPSLLATRTTTTTTTTSPLPRLWEPDPMVKTLLWPLILQRLDNNDDDNDKWCYDRIDIWDLGAGSGRDICFLAEACRQRQQEQQCAKKSRNHGYNNDDDNHRHTGIHTMAVKLVAMDQRYAGPAERQQCLDFWRRRGVQDYIECVPMNLGNVQAVQQYYQQQQHEMENDVTINANNKSSSNNNKKSRRQLVVLYAVRFWNKLLVQHLLDHVLLPGTPTATTNFVFAVSHFGKPSVCAEWNFEHPKEKHVLQRNELSEMFLSSPASASATSSFRWHTHHDRVVTDGDHGRMLIQFVAELSPSLSTTTTSSPSTLTSSNV